MRRWWPPALRRQLEAEREWRMRSLGRLLAYEAEIAALKADVERLAQAIADLRGDAAVTS